MVYLSVIIPAYNEESRLGPTLTKIAEFLKTKSYPSEILVVDDGSTDRTGDIVNELREKYPTIKLLSNPQNCGKGYSVRMGVKAAQGEFILFSDADLSTPIEELDKFLAQILENNFDIVVGSRALPDSRIIVHQPIYRVLAGKIFNKIARLFTIKKIKDSQCGFKLFRKEAAKKIFAKTSIKRFAFDVEVLFIAQRQGYKIKEIPVRWYNSPLSRVGFFRDSLNMFLDVIRIWQNYLRGRYQ